MNNFFGFFMHGGDEVDLAPLVDIAFLLLTFFIMTAAFVSQDIDLKPEIPKSSSITKEPDARYVTIIVGDSAKGLDKLVVFMDDVGVREKALDGIASRQEALSTKGFAIQRDPSGKKWKQTLFQILYKARKADPGQTIVLRGDTKRDFGTIYDIMLVMRSVRFDKVQIVTELEQ